MSDRNKVQKVGRVEYIEPNSLFGEDISVQNVIHQPYENYSFSVNLRVINGNRYDCGMPSNDEDFSNKVIEYSSDNGTISFMNGTEVNGEQGYLTTNFTDISMNDPNTNTKECLGIESISIKYTSWYTPTVDIRFIDVRGASLMQPSEYDYYNTGGPTPKKPGDYSPSNSDFFKAFFRFPYPLFKLSVKGFYGKEVTYDLSVVSCDIEFNSETGNFEINASFIGYMYGIYGDLPFSFIYLAPYIDNVGKNTWKEKKGSGDFCYLSLKPKPELSAKENESTNPKETGPTEMYTFPELIKAVKTAGQEAEKMIKESESGQTFDELTKLAEKMKLILGKWPMASWASWSKYAPETENRDGYFYLVLPETEPLKTIHQTLLSFYEFGTLLDDYNKYAAESKYSKKYVEEYQATIKSIYDDIKIWMDKVVQGRENERAYLISTANFSPEEQERVMSGRIVSLVFEKNDRNKEKPTLTYNASESKLGGATGYVDLVNELIARFNNDEPLSPMPTKSNQKKWTVLAFKAKNINYRLVLNKTLNDISAERDELQNKIDEKRDLEVINALHFDPTMKNLFNMVFAHTDTFMSVFYNTLRQIKNSIESDDQSRRKDFVCGKDVEVDVNDATLQNSISNGGKLPPFPMFYKEETVKDSEDKVMKEIWPGNLENGKNLAEVALVEAIINATALNSRSFESVTPKDNVQKREGELAPINYYDIIRNNGNPYLDVLTPETLKNDPNVVTNVVKTFILRCFYTLLTGSFVAPDTGSTKDVSSPAINNLTEKARLIADLEAGNVERAFKMLKTLPVPSFINQLMTLNDDGKIFLSEYMTGDTSIFKTIHISEGGVNSGVVYRWINEGERYFLPVGTFVPEKLENLAKKARLRDDSDKFIHLAGNSATGTGLSCHVYKKGKVLEDIIQRYPSGDFKKASRLFKNYGRVPETISNIKIGDKMFSGTSESLENLNVKKLYEKIGNEGSLDIIPSLPSFRKTANGITSVFMDPLYYAQDTDKKGQLARAYLFLMGIPFGQDDSFFLPEKIENGDYPTLLLLREGAAYWRARVLITAIGDTTDIAAIDPIKYTFTVNGVRVDTLPDIEKNDPRFGREYVTFGCDRLPKNTSTAREETLVRLFAKWATGDEFAASASATAHTENNIEIPALGVSFTDIEANLALFGYTDTGTEKKLLSYVGDNAPTSAITYPFVSSYANADILTTVYEIKSDGSLGKLEANTRKEVFITSIPNAANAESFLSRFKLFCVGFNSIMDFSYLDNPGIGCSVPRTVLNEAISRFIAGLKKYCEVDAESLKSRKGTSSTGISPTPERGMDLTKSTDVKLACYIALKNLYDRWLCSRDRSCWNFSCIPERMTVNGRKSEFAKFFYIDEFYHENGMQIRPNLTDFTEFIQGEGAFNDTSNEFNLASKSLLQMLSTTAQQGGCALLTLPTMLGLAKTYSDDRNSIEDVFKAFPYNEAVHSDDIETSFIVLYTHRKSSFLNNADQTGENAYKDDGFDIANTWGKVVPVSTFSDGGEDDFAVPCFGVSFAQQNQSYFKNIRLNMNNHNLTEYAIRNTVRISYANNEGSHKTSIVGQDLYSVYSNYSYTCSVNMMGDAQITPLMYFQLNNIPMWKGAYLITEVSHNITVNGMETTFVGTRQARPSTPYKDDKIILLADSAAGMTPQSQENTTVASPEDANRTDFRSIPNVNVENVENLILLLRRTSINEEDKRIDGVLSLRVGYPDDFMVYDGFAMTAEYYNPLKTPDDSHYVDKIDNLNPDDYSGRLSEIKDFTIPPGKYENVSLLKIRNTDEYRDPNDGFYGFTDGGHIMVLDKKLGSSIGCEIITGETGYDKLSENFFDDIKIGGASPVMIYKPRQPSTKGQTGNTDEIRTLYTELFTLISKIREKGKPVSIIITQDFNL